MIWGVDQINLDENGNGEAKRISMNKKHIKIVGFFGNLFNLFANKICNLLGLALGVV